MGFIIIIFYLLLHVVDRLELGWDVHELGTQLIHYETGGFEVVPARFWFCIFPTHFMQHPGTSLLD